MSYETGCTEPDSRAGQTESDPGRARLKLLLVARLDTCHQPVDTNISIFSFLIKKEKK